METARSLLTYGLALLLSTVSYAMPESLRENVKSEESIYSTVSSLTYNIGDIYDKDGVRGIVIHTTDEGRHGLIMALTSPYYTPDKIKRYDEKCWCIKLLNGQRIGLDDTDDGMNNMLELEKSLKYNNLLWEDFPAFKICHDMGPGWYLPAINEVELIVRAMNGGELIEKSLALYRFNTILSENGGTPIGKATDHEPMIQNSGYEFIMLYQTTIVSSTEWDGYSFCAWDNYGGNMFRSVFYNKLCNGYDTRIIAVHKF